MSRLSSLSEWVLRLPLLWGGLACLAFYALIAQGAIDSPLVVRYFASHPVEYVTTALFFAGLAALIIRLLGVTAQFALLQRELIEPIPPGRQPASDAARILEELTDLPGASQESYLVRRLREALEHVRRKSSAAHLDDHLRHLEDVDAARMMSGYAMVRIAIWAIPMLGFLGTVIGITLAIAKLAPTALEQSVDQVTGALGVAFDTTALALSLSILLMFVKFGVEWVEGKLLARVDAHVQGQLVGRFQDDVYESDPEVASVRRMSELVLEAVETMTARQAELWRSSIDQTHEQWAAVTSTAGQVLEDSFSAAVSKNLEQHARKLNDGVTDHANRLNKGIEQSLTHLHGGLERLAELLVEALEQHGESLARNEKELAQENRQHLSEVEAALGESMVVAADRQERLIGKAEQMLREMEVALVESAGAAAEQQEQLAKQCELLLRIVDATGQVKELEATLNQNLASLGGVHSFDESLVSLSAAIQLLSARLHHGAPHARSVEFGPHKAANSAA